MSTSVDTESRVSLDERCPRNDNEAQEEAPSTYLNFGVSKSFFYLHIFILVWNIVGLCMVIPYSDCSASHFITSLRTWILVSSIDGSLITIYTIYRKRLPYFLYDLKKANQLSTKKIPDPLEVTNSVFNFVWTCIGLGVAYAHRNDDHCSLPLYIYACIAMGIDTILYTILILSFLLFGCFTGLNKILDWME